MPQAARGKKDPRTGVRGFFVASSTQRWSGEASGLVAARVRAVRVHAWGRLRRSVADGLIHPAAVAVSAAVTTIAAIARVRAVAVQAVDRVAILVPAVQVVGV